MGSLVAYWGHEWFRVTPWFTFTFNDFERDSGGRYNYLERIGMKPLTDYAGPGLDEITFTAILEKSLGLNPRAVVDWWNRLSNAGKADVLVVGNKMIGKNKWTLKSVKEHWNNIDGKGNVISGTMDLSFEEYMDS